MYQRPTHTYTRTHTRPHAASRRTRDYGRYLPLVPILVGLLLVGALIFLYADDELADKLYPRRYEEYVEYYAGKYELDPLLVYAFIRTESNFVPDARSDADARGLMQITEVTFDWIKSNIAPDEAITFDQLDDPELNIRFGTYFVKACLLRYASDISTAAAAYHSGWGTVDELLADTSYSADGETLTEFPYPQMRNYVKKINANYQRYCQLYGQAG